MLFSITLASLGFAVAFVQAQTTVPVTKIVNIMDFQGNVLDLAFGSSAELAPVQTLNHKPDTTPQAWLIEAGVGPNLFTIQNIASGTFLSVTTTISGSQLCGHARAFQWKILVNGNKFNIIEPTTGEGVTTWVISTSSLIGPTSPVTIQNPAPASAQQLFTLPGFT
ncbi:hypothetical protein FB451DRAFT_1366163 [Mycena latifolia]|nr:hypothetical protein FB451DRAFT_1366163 [Mycena latifolia]